VDLLDVDLLDEELDDPEASLVDFVSPLELEELESEVLELDSDPPELSEFSEPDTFFLLPDLKSVSYQPLPFSLKPAAEIFLIRLSFPHSGQSTSLSSLSFCIASSSWSQLSHRYSYIGISVLFPH